MTTESKRIQQTGDTVNISNFFRRLVYGDNAMDGRASIVRTVVVWAFIALVALLFTQPLTQPLSQPLTQPLTHPTGEPASVFDGPIPLPAELGLGPGPPFF